MPQYLCYIVMYRCQFDLAFKMSISTDKYHVVEFKDGLEIVPSSWLGDNNKCKYPAITSKKKRDKAVIMNAKPEANWKNYTILRTFAVCDTYNEACIKCEKVMYASDFNTDLDEADKENNFEKRQDKTKQNKEKQKNEIHKNLSEGHSQSQSEFQDLNVQMTNTITQITHLKTITNVMNTNIIKIKMDIMDMKMDIQRIYGIVSKLKETQDVPLSKCSIASQAVIALHSIFPLQTKEQLDKLEKDVKSVEKEAQLNAFLDTIGGIDPSETVKRCLVKIFSNKLAKEFSWQGRKGKHKLCNLKLMDIMYRSLLARCVNMDEKKFQNRVQEWFRQAAARYRNEILRNSTNSITLEEETEVTETEETMDDLHFDDVELQNEKQLQ